MRRNESTDRYDWYTLHREKEKIVCIANTGVKGYSENFELTKKDSDIFVIIFYTCEHITTRLERTRRYPFSYRIILNVVYIL